LNLSILARDGKPIAGSTLKKFAASLDGSILEPGNNDYESLRRLWTGLIDPRHPALIVRCSGESDVVRAISFARNNQITVAVRSAGHSLAGDSFCEGGMLIDISGMKRIEVDPVAGVARAQTGLTVGEFDHATQGFGLATVLGECSAVGISGFTLGGGLGRLMGKHGVACDNLVSAELVTAEGSLVRANAAENGDLFWGLQGGGGNFGVVTSLEYRLHPVGRILGGTLTYPISAIRDVLHFVDNYMTEVPDEFDIVVDIGNNGITALAHGIMEPIVNLVVSYCDDLQKGEAALRPLRSFRRPLSDSIRSMPYVAMQSLSDTRPLAEYGSSGASFSLEGGFIEGLGSQVIETINGFLDEAPPCFWITAEHYLHGAASLPAVHERAFSLRRRGYTTRIFAGWTSPGEADRSAAWVKRLNTALARFSDGALYTNYLTGVEGDAGVRAAYGTNYDRLVALKNRYDPDNFFSSNRNIKPDSTLR